MRKYAFLIVCLLLHAFAVTAQDTKPTGQPSVQVVFETPAANKDAIYYAPGRMLQVTDFKGPVDEANPAAAVTFCNISIGINIHTANGKKEVKVTLSVFADASKNWMRPGQQANAVLLAHEQLHFEIAGIVACRLKEQIASTAFTNENVHEEIGRLYREAIASLHAEQEQYDNETAHGTVEEAQAKWRSRVAGELAGLHCF